MSSSSRATRTCRSSSTRRSPRRIPTASSSCTRARRRRTTCTARSRRCSTCRPRTSASSPRRTAAASAARAIRSITRSSSRRRRWMLDRPVKICLTREEVFYCHRGRHPVLMRFRTGVTNDGQDHRHRPRDAARRRRVRHLRRREHLLHGRAADGDLPDSALSLPRLPHVHQQAAVRAEARPRHAAGRVRPGGAARQDRRGAGDRSGRSAPAKYRAGRFAHGQLPARRNDRPRRVHRARDDAVGLAREISPAARRQGPRPRLLLVPLRRGSADLLERPAALGRAAQARPQRRRHGVLRRDRDRPGLGRCPRGVRRGGARHRSVRHPRGHRRHRPHAGRPRLVLEPRDADDGQRRDPGGRARARDPRGGRVRAARRAARSRSCSRIGASSTRAIRQEA